MESTETPKSRAQALLDELGLTIKSDFVPFSRSRHAKDREKTLNWLVTVLHKGRDVLTTDYSAGIAHAPSYGGHGAPLFRRMSVETQKAIDTECETGRDMKRNMRIEPVDVDVFNSLVQDSDVLNYSSFEDWADECGLDTDSRKAEQMYRACMTTALALRSAIGDANLGRLREAFRDY